MQEEISKNESLPSPASQQAALRGLWLVTAIFVLSFPLAIILANTDYGKHVAGFWPKLNTLQSFCSAHRCIYDPVLVADIYILHIAIAVAMMTAVAVWMCMTNVDVKTLFRFVIVEVAALASGLYLVLNSFDFETSEHLRHENAIATSYLPIFRAMFPSLIACIFAVLFVFEHSISRGNRKSVVPTQPIDS